MVRSTRSQRLREKMRDDIKHSKQTTLSAPPQPSKPKSARTDTAAKPKRQIEITELNTKALEDELVLNVGFRLLPSRTAFSRVTADLYFDELKIDSLNLRIIQGQLATEEFEFQSKLIMTGIEEGQHILRVEMYELWSTGERLANISKEVAIDYHPVKKEDRLIRVPIIKNAAGADLVVVTDSERNIFREIAKDMKEESESRRDHW